MWRRRTLKKQDQDTLVKLGLKALNVLLYALLSAIMVDSLLMMM